MNRTTAHPSKSTASDHSNQLAQTKRRSQQIILASLLLITIASFGGLLIPSVYTQMQSSPLAKNLSSTMQWVWSTCVFLSTFAVVGAVGYGQSIGTNAEDNSLAREPATTRKQVGDRSHQLQAAAEVKTALFSC